MRLHVRDKHWVFLTSCLPCFQRWSLTSLRLINSFSRLQGSTSLCLPSTEITHMALLLGFHVVIKPSSCLLNPASFPALLSEETHCWHVRFTEHCLACSSPTLEKMCSLQTVKERHTELLDSAPLRSTRPRLLGLSHGCWASRFSLQLKPLVC